MKCAIESASEDTYLISAITEVAGTAGNASYCCGLGLVSREGSEGFASWDSSAHRLRT